MPQVDYYHVIWNEGFHRYEVKHVTIVTVYAFWDAETRVIREVHPVIVSVSSSHYRNVQMTPEGGIVGYAAATALIKTFPECGPY